MWRVASLRNNFEGSTRHCLDVCVADAFWETREESARPMNGPGNDNDHHVIGVVTFQDARRSDEIVKDFALRYPGNFGTEADAAERCAYARYIPQFGDFLVQAFVRYFSKRQ